MEESGEIGDEDSGFVGACADASGSASGREGESCRGHGCVSDSVCELNNKKGGRDEAIFSSCPKVSDG